MIKNNPFPKIYRELKCLWKKIKEIEQSPPGSGIQSIQDGNGTDINNTDPNNPIINILEVSATQKGIVNNTALQELGGVDKLINGVRIGKGSGNDEDNVVVGKDALSTNTTGTYNTAFGGWVLTENTTGSFNSSFGSGALYSNTTGIYNNAFGVSTLQNNTTGSRNIGVGTSLFWNTTGQENTGVGSNAGYGATTGSQNTYIGNQAGYNNGIGSYNTAIGSRAMITSGTGIPASTLDMNRNVFIGAGLTLADGVNNVLAIDNRGATNTFYSNALLYGNFADRFLRINGRFEIAPSTMPTPDVNFNKKLVYNPTDGKVTAVDDTSGEGDQSDNLLFEYVHSGNKEVYIDSIDYDTNTFTSVGHGLVNGDRLGLNLLKQINDINQSPFTKLPVNTMVSFGFHLVNITTDTFQIATTNGGEPITLINQSTLDLSFFRFEVVKNTTLTFSEINLNDIEMIVVGGFARNPRYIAFKGVENISFTSRTNGFFGNMYHDGLWSLGGTYSISIITNDKEEVRQRTWNLLQFDPMFSNGVLNEIVYSIDNTENSLVFSGGFSPYNGTTIKIYKL